MPLSTHNKKYRQCTFNFRKLLVNSYCRLKIVCIITHAVLLTDYLTAGCHLTALMLINSGSLCWSRKQFLRWAEKFFSLYAVCFWNNFKRLIFDII